VASVTKHRCG